MILCRIKHMVLQEDMGFPNPKVMFMGQDNLIKVLMGLMVEVCIKDIIGLQKILGLLIVMDIIISLKDHNGEEINLVQVKSFLKVMEILF